MLLNIYTERHDMHPQIAAWNAQPLTALIVARIKSDGVRRCCEKIKNNNVSSGTD